MKKGLRYFFARLMVLIVALRILDASVDIDHLTLGSAVVDVAGYDDTDSFSELLIEMITRDSNFVAESNSDDQSPVQKQISKYNTDFVFYSYKHEYRLNPLFQTVVRFRKSANDIGFHDEDFSAFYCPPPDSGKSAA